MFKLRWGGWGEDGGGQLECLSDHQLTMCGFRLIDGLGSQCRAWWKPKTLVDKVINIVTGVACCTRLLPSVQMAGNVPDPLTLLWDPAAGVAQPLQPSNLLPRVCWMWPRIRVNVNWNTIIGASEFIQAHFSSLTHAVLPLTYIKHFFRLPIPTVFWVVFLCHCKWHNLTTDILSKCFPQVWPVF